SFTNRELNVGTLKRVLIAVEETANKRYRRIRRPLKVDVEADAVALKLVRDKGWRGPDVQLAGTEGRRASHYGFATVGDLFSPRQTALFATAFEWISSVETSEGTRRALYLALSNALTSNNVLCGYATDYGRLAPLFAGVRSFAVPV